MADREAVARRAGTSADRIVFLGHATVLIELGGVRLLTDPVLLGRVAHLRRQVPPPVPSALERVDAVLISHLHHDHLDLASLRRLGEETPVVVPAGAAEWLRRRGFRRVTELEVGQSASFGGVEVQAVPAHHDARRPGAPRAPALGYLLRGRQKVYFAGDTGLFDAMSDIAPALDVALLPVAGWGSRLGPGHMGPRDAAIAAAMLSPRIAIPIHWGTLRPIGTGARGRAQLADPPRLFAEQTAVTAPQVRVTVLAPGQETTL